MPGAGTTSIERPPRWGDAALSKCDALGALRFPGHGIAFALQPFLPALGYGWVIFDEQAVKAGGHENLRILGCGDYLVTCKETQTRRGP
jgi:hypothetical protein